jgi:hypothetical protein
VRVDVGDTKRPIAVFDVELSADGTEGGTQFSLHFDPAVMTISQVSGVNSNPDVTLPDSAPTGTSLNVNAEDVWKGDIGIVENFGSSGSAIPAGAHSIVRLTFDILNGNPRDVSDVSFTDDVVVRHTVDTVGRELDVPRGYIDVGTTDTKLSRLFSLLFY